MATAVGGVTELVRPGQTGWLVADRDLEGLVRAIEKAAQEASLMRHDAERAGERFSWAAVGRLFDNLLEEARKEIQ